MKTVVACTRCLRAALILLLVAPVYAQVAPPSSLPRTQSRELVVPPSSGGATVPVQNGLVPNNASQTLYQLPAGAYVLSYQDATGTLQQFDATVTWDPRQIKHSRREVPDDMTIGFGGRQFAGVLAAGSNRFASSQTAAGQPLLDGTLTADGAMSGHYYADDHGYPVRNPFQYTLSPKPVANLGTEQRARTDVAVSRATPGSGNGTNAIAGTRPGSRESLNPQPLPPMPNWNAKPGDANSLNPQPLPPMPGPNWNARPGDASSLNPQPLPPKPESNWTANAVGTGSLNGQSLPSSGTAAANSRPEVAANSRPTQNSNAVAATQVVRTDSVAASGPVSDLAARRLRAAGLDPTSPTFRKQLDNRLQTIAKSQTRQSTAPSTKNHVADLVRAKLGARANIATMTTQQRSAASYVVRSAVSPGMASAPALLDALPPFSLLDYKAPAGAITMPSVYVIPFRRPAQPVASQTAQRVKGQDSASVRITIPACGVDATHIASVLTADQMGTMYAGLLATSPDWHFEGREFALFIALSDIVDGEFPLGALARHGTMTFAVDGLISTTDWDFAAFMLDSRWSAVVDATAPFLGMNSIGLTTANATFGQPTIERVNLSDQPMQGEDILGTSLQLGAGYVAHAEIVASQSVADLGGDTSPDNAYRGASVVVQPQAHRLQTTVKWHIGPGDSLQYQVQWTLTGPDGQRPLTSMPKQGVCDS